MNWIPASFTKRALAVVIIAAGGAMSAGAYALPADNAGKMDCAAMHGKHGHKTQAERVELRVQHLAALKTKLNLSAQQEAAWSAFNTTRQGPMRSKSDRQAMKAELAKMTTPQRVDKMLAMSEARSAKMIARAQATKTFYAQLTPAQQAVFDAEAKFRGHGRGGHPQKS